MNITLFEKVIDRNLIYDHAIFTCQDLINSGMMVINLAIMKSFVDGRNSFIIEERKNLDLNMNASLDLDNDNEGKLQVISHYNKRWKPIH